MLAKNIQKARRNAGLTQKQISDLIGIPPGTYAGYETGNSEPAVEIIQKIAEATNTSVEHLISGTPHPAIRENSGKMLEIINKQQDMLSAQHVTIHMLVDIVARAK